MSDGRKEYIKPVMEVLELKNENVILTSAKKLKNPALCTAKNPGLCDLGFNPGHGCSNINNPGNESYGGKYKQQKKC